MNKSLNKMLEYVIIQIITSSSLIRLLIGRSAERHRDYLTQFNIAEKNNILIRL